MLPDGPDGKVTCPEQILVGAGFGVVNRTLGPQWLTGSGLNHHPAVPPRPLWPPQASA